MGNLTYSRGFVLGFLLGPVCVATKYLTSGSLGTEVVECDRSLKLPYTNRIILGFSEGSSLKIKAFPGQKATQLG